MPISQIDFEIIGVRGFLSIEGAQNYLKDAVFKADEVEGSLTLSNGIAVGSLFTREQLGKNGLIGRADAEGEVDPKDRSKSKVINAWCVASAYTTRVLANEPEEMEAKPDPGKSVLACSVRGTLQFTDTCDIKSGV